MNAPGHEMIRASAGSGKTHQLCLRMIRLLLAGVEPPRLVALTFTRKAAGEFLSKLLVMLSDAASDPQGADRLAAQLAGEDPAGAVRAPTDADFRAVLESVVHDLHRLSLGTLDGFLHRLLRSFPLEFGMGGEVALMDPPEAARARSESLRQAFRVEGAARDALVSAFQRATFGGGGRVAATAMADLIEAYHQDFLLAPDEEMWGGETAIWGAAGCPWPKPPYREEELVRELREATRGLGMPDNARAHWEKALSELAAWRAGGTPPAAARDLLTKAARALEYLRAGAAEIVVMRHRVGFEGEAARALAALASVWIGHEIRVKLEETRGIHNLIEAYERTYDRLYRSRGRLVFADLPLLLSRGVEDMGRWDIDFRMDGRFDHWLIDEFQDTSRLQWLAIGNLIDEVIQDAGGERGFFAVGDIKQSIYAWRGGDPELFGEILKRYNQGEEPVIRERPLDVSWRSVPAVLDLVNAVCSDRPALGGVFSAGVVDRWQALWSPHSPAAPLRDGTGHAALIDCPEDQCWQATTDLIRTMDPIGRGLSCAVLVQKNSRASECVEALRGAGIHALRDGASAFGRDNSVGRLLHHLLTLAAHPGDAYSRRFLEMGPLGTVVRNGGIPGVASWDQVGDRVRREIERDGYEATLERWIGLLPAEAAAEPFTAGRIGRLLELAMDYDQAGGGDLVEFVELLDGGEDSAASADGVVQVMTFHKSKGLGFDVVILPDLGPLKGNPSGNRLARERDAAGRVRWLMALPRKDVARGDEVLARASGAQEERDEFEDICSLYVGLTRARRAVYAIAPKPSAGSTARSHARWMHRALDTGDREHGRLAGHDVVWESGDREWYRDETPPGQTAETDVPALVPPSASGPSPLPAMPRETPSGHSGAGVDAVRLLQPGSRRAMSLGRSIHRRLAGIDWIDAGEPPARGGGWPDEDELVRQVFESRAIRELLRRPSAAAEVFTEQAFTVRMDGRVLDGVFDRIVIESDGGRAVSCHVVDFKTDQCGPDDGERLAALVDSHRGQMEAYRRAAGILCGLRADEVRCSLVFLRAGAVVDV